jgi:hypothetical protein
LECALLLTVTDYHCQLFVHAGFGGERRGDFSGDLMPGVGGGFPGSGGSLMGPDHPMFGGPSGMGYPQVSYCNNYFSFICSFIGNGAKRT